MAQRKKNLKQQKQKQKQHQKQQVIVNVITSKKRRATRRAKPSSSSSQQQQQPLITTLPIQYTPYTMYDTSQLLTEANMRSLIPTKAPASLIEQGAINNNINIDDLRKYRDRHYRIGGGEILVDAQNQTPVINDIMQNIEQIMQPAIAPVIAPVIEPVVEPIIAPLIEPIIEPIIEQEPSSPNEDSISVKKKIICDVCGGSYIENRIIKSKSSTSEGETDFIRHAKTDKHIKAMTARNRKK